MSLRHPCLPEELDALLVSSGIMEDPYPIYHRLREFAPVAWSRNWNAWVVSMYPEVFASLRDKENLSNENRQALLFSDMSDTERDALAYLRHYFAQKDVIGSDPPDHTRLRGLVQKAFTPRMVQSLEPRIRTLARELIAQGKGKQDFDLVRDLAHPLPVILIAELLGAPPGDRHLFQQWSSDILSFQGTGRAEYQVSMRSQASLHAMFDYVLAIVEQRRHNPQDDLITALAQAEEAGRGFTRDELLATCNTLLTAGHETTSNLIGNLYRHVLANEDFWHSLEPGSPRIPNLVEECLRIDAPKQRNFRRCRREHQFAGTLIRENEMVFQLIGSANRDGKTFPEPDRFDPDRSNAKDHLSFGSGIHFCLGAPLARMEARIALEELRALCPGIRLRPGPVHWQERVQFRGPASLPVT